MNKQFLRTLTFLLLASVAAPAMASTAETSTFWIGLVDGFLSLMKLLVSPVFDVALVAEDFGTWGYRAGYYMGALSFVGVAGAAASPRAGETDVASGWGSPQR